MSEKKFTVQPGDEIIIRIPARRKSVKPAPSESPARQKALLRPHRFDDSGARRLSKGGLLNFYDVGLVKSGDEYIDLSFVISKPTVSSESIAVGFPSEADFRVFTESLLETPLDDWKDNFYRITKDDAENYDLALIIKPDADDEIALDDSNADWTEDGLKVKAVSRLAFHNFGAFFYFDTSDSDFVKVTREPTYESDAASLNLSKGGDVFLIPPLAYYQSEAFLSPKIHILDFLWLTFQRTRFKPMGFFRRDFTGSPITGTSEINEFLGYLKSLPSARHLSIVSFAPPPGTTVQIESTGAYPAAGSDEFLSLTASAQGSAAADFYEGKLLAVVQTGSGNYFVWAQLGLGFSKQFAVDA